MEKNAEQQVDLRDYLRAIIKRRWTVITVFAATVITVTIYAFTATPVYEATTRLIIDKENPNVVSIQEVMSVDASGSDYYQTQYKIIESRTVAREVIKRLHLDESEEFFPNPKNNFVSNLKRSIMETVASWIDSIVFLLNTDSKSKSQVPEGYEEESELVSDFIDMTEVRPIRNSRLVDIKFQAKDPVLAARIVNEIARVYMDKNLETKLRAVQDAVKWLHKRIEEEREKVGKAEEALLRYKERYNIITDFSSDTEKITAQKLAQLNDQVVEAESKRVEAETRYKQAKAMRGMPDMLDSIPEVLKSEIVREIKKIEVELYKRMSELSKKYGRKHPQMVAVESELNTIQKRKRREVNKIINSLRNEYKVALAKEKSLKSALVKQKKESLGLNQKAIRYGVLKREAESARQMYELLIKRFKETTLTEDMKTGNIRVMDRAEVPKHAFKPRKKLNILLAMIVSLITGVGLAFFFEYLDNTIKLPEDIKKHLNIPYLGPVPAIAKGENPHAEGRVDLVTLHSPKSMASEAYRGIRTSILFSSSQSVPQVILVSSAGPQEGKTVTATNLAITMAQSGSKVIVIDCDLRRPKIHKIFDFTRDEGVTNLLVGKKNISGVVVNTGIKNLDIIPCGPIPPNPSEILGSGRMTNLIGILRRNYTRILIDSPPVTAVTDAVVLSKFVDGVVLVVRANYMAREIIKNGLNQLQSVGASVLGVVLNCVDMSRGGYYSQYYSYYYGEDGEKSKRPHRKKKPESQYL